MMARKNIAVMIAVLLLMDRVSTQCTTECEDGQICKENTDGEFVCESRRSFVIFVNFTYVQIIGYKYNLF